MFVFCEKFDVPGLDYWTCYQLLYLFLPANMLFLKHELEFLYLVVIIFLNFLKFLGTTKLMIKQEQYLLFKCRFVISNWE